MSNTRFPKEKLDQYSLTPPTKEFLQTIGLPEWAPHYLGFGDFEGVFLPRLSEWTELKHSPPEELTSMIVIGSDGDENPICISEESGQVFCLDQDQSFKQVLMNSSVLQLAGTLNDYESMVDEAINTTGDSAYIEYRFPSTLIDKFKEKLGELDPPAITQGSFWANEITRLREGLKEFESLEKYNFKIFATISDKEEETISIKVKGITVAAEAPVVRAIGEFFLQTADELDKYGEAFDHSHLRDSWRKWYSAYPDMIIYKAQ